MSVNVTSPALIVIGKVVALSEQMAWMETKALLGKKVVVTRSRKQSSKLSHGLNELGAVVLELPAIEIVAPDDDTLLVAALQNLQQYDWLLFSSSNAVDAFFQKLKNLKMDIRELAGIKIAAVGPVTKSTLEELGLTVELLPEHFSSDALGQALAKMDIAGKKMLFPRAAKAREKIIEDLQAAGSTIDCVVVYQTQAVSHNDHVVQDMVRREPDLLTFASAATVDHFILMTKAACVYEQIKKIPAICIGPITAAAATAAGLNVVTSPSEYTLDAMLDCIREYLQRPSLTA